MSGQQNQMECDRDLYIFPCPQCGLLVTVLRSEINCAIFRHAVYKDGFTQVDPHLPKVDCDLLIQQGNIYGCCKPYELYETSNGWQARRCTYK